MNNYEKAVHSLGFTKKFLDILRKKEYKINKTLHTNGIPQHYILVFQLLCLMKDDEMSSEDVSKIFPEIFGRTINHSSLSRTFTYLQNTLGLVTYVDNPFGDKRYRWLRLTGKGKELQKYFLGTTTEKTPVWFSNGKLRTGT